MIKFSRILSLFVFGLLCVLNVLFTVNFSLVTLAESKVYSGPNCKSQQITLTNLFSITKNIPIIPEDCALDANKNPRPLSPALLGDIAVRGYAFLISLAFTIITPSLVAMGLLWMYSGIDEAQAGFVKKWVQSLTVGLVLVIFAYIVPFTIMSVFNFSPSQTNLDSFFTFK